MKIFQVVRIGSKHMLQTKLLHLHSPAYELDEQIVVNHMVRFSFCSLAMLRVAGKLKTKSSRCQGQSGEI